MNDLTRCTIRKHDVGDRAVLVIDGSFDEPFVRMLYYFMSRLPFSLSDYDSEETKHIRHWKYEFDLTSLPPFPLVSELLARCTSFAHDLYSSKQLKLNRMHCNLHLYGDLQYPHIDLARGVTV